MRRMHAKSSPSERSIFDNADHDVQMLMMYTRAAFYATEPCNAAAYAPVEACGAHEWSCIAHGWRDFAISAAAPPATHAAALAAPALTAALAAATLTATLAAAALATAITTASLAAALSAAAAPPPICAAALGRARLACRSDGR